MAGDGVLISLHMYTWNIITRISFHSNDLISINLLCFYNYYFWEDLLDIYIKISKINFDLIKKLPCSEIILETTLKYTLVCMKNEWCTFSYPCQTPNASLFTFRDRCADTLAAYSLRCFVRPEQASKWRPKCFVRPSKQGCCRGPYTTERPI
jgi:hypothetical protein